MFVFLNRGFPEYLVSCGCYAMVYCIEKLLWSIIYQLNEGVFATLQGNLYKIMFSDIQRTVHFRASDLFFSLFSDQQTLFRLF